MRGRLRLRRSVIGIASVGLLAIAGCTATPRYPVERGVAPGDGFQPIAPRYPVAETPAAPLTPTRDGETPVVPRTPAAATSTMAEASSEPVVESPLAPVRSGSGRSASSSEVTSRTDTPAPAVSPPGRVHRIPGALSYVIVHGDTLYGVARRFGVGPAALASANGLGEETALHPGLRLKLPSSSHDAGEQVHATGVAERAAARIVAVAPSPPRRAGAFRGRPGAEVAAPGAPIPYDQLVGRAGSGGRGSPGTIARSAPSSVPDTPAASSPPVEGEPAVDGLALRGMHGRFIRPVHGPTLSAFGAKGPGQRNDGVDLSAREGEVVRASASGVVVYAGHDVPALGNLVAVKHADGWVTVYGNLEKITVKPTERLVQGAPLGVAGATAVTPTPQVHFEVRYASDPSEKAHPIDPELVLPKAG